MPNGMTGRAWWPSRRRERTFSAHGPSRSSAPGDRALEAPAQLPDDGHHRSSGRPRCRQGLCIVSKSNCVATTVQSTRSQRCAALLEPSAAPGLGRPFPDSFVRAPRSGSASGAAGPDPVVFSSIGRSSSTCSRNAAKVGLRYRVRVVMPGTVRGGPWAAMVWRRSRHSWRWWPRALTSRALTGGRAGLGRHCGRVARLKALDTNHEAATPCGSRLRVTCWPSSAYTGPGSRWTARAQVPSLLTAAGAVAATAVEWAFRLPAERAAPGVRLGTRRYPCRLLTGTRTRTTAR